MKTCSKCKELKPLVAFNKQGDRPCGVTSRCKECLSEIRKLEYKTKPDRKTNIQNDQLKRRYGIDLLEYNRLLEIQNYRCAGCNGHQSEFSSSLSVDHDHNCCPGKSCGKCVRGLLCTNCNLGEGAFKGNPNTYFALLEHIGIDIDAALTQYRNKV